MEKTPLKKTRPVRMEKPLEIERPLTVGVGPLKVPKSIVRFRPSLKFLRRIEVGLDGITDFMGGATALDISPSKTQECLSEMLPKVV